jgi:hypothetical protein
MKIIIAKDSSSLSITRKEWEQIGKENNWIELRGGEADGMDVNDIAEKHEVSSDQIEEQLEKGMEVEKEHSDDPAIREEISLDHLTEHEKYYDYLEEAENKFKKDIPVGDIE